MPENTASWQALDGCLTVRADEKLTAFLELEYAIRRENFRDLSTCQGSMEKVWDIKAVGPRPRPESGNVHRTFRIVPLVASNQSLNRWALQSEGPDFGQANFRCGRLLPTLRG